MEKRIEDFLKYYIGGDVMEVGNNRGKIFALGQLGGDGKSRALVNCSSNDSYWTALENLKPILRKLETVTEDEWIDIEGLLHILPEAIGIGMLKDNFMVNTTETRCGWQVVNHALVELRKRSVDVDGLIEAGLAIDQNPK